MYVYELLGHRRVAELFKSSDDTKYRGNDRTTNKPIVERLSEWELKELMGCNRDTYKKVNGKVKRK